MTRPLAGGTRYWLVRSYVPQTDLFRYMLVEDGAAPVSDDGVILWGPTVEACPFPIDVPDGASLQDLIDRGVVAKPKP